MTDDIYAQFIDYARKKNYSLSQTQSIAKDNILGNIHTTNAYCNDAMQIMLVMTAENKLQLVHCGHYCALAHASAELLCESYEQLSLDNFVYTVHYINNGLKNHSSASLMYDTNDYLQMAISVLEKKMNATREQCFMLSWNAVLLLLEIIEKMKQK